MSDWDQEIPNFKAKKLGQIESRPVKGNKKKSPVKKPFRVMYTFMGKDQLMHRAVTQEDAEKWIQKERTNYYHQKHASDAVNDARREAKEERVAKYWIKNTSV